VLAQRLRALGASPLAGRAFVLLASGRAISMLGSAMAPVALAFAVLRLTHSTGDLGIVLAARSVSVVVFLLLGGVISERLRCSWDRACSRAYLSRRPPCCC